MSDLICRNVRISGRRTSIKLEADMWEALFEICENSGRNLHDICTEVHQRRGSSNFTSAMRLFILDYYRAGFGAWRPVARIRRQVGASRASA